MDFKLPTSLLKEYLHTNLPLAKVAEYLTLCGPTIERVQQVGEEAVWDIEVITNRVDMASALGIAREAAAILPSFEAKARLKIDPYAEVSIPPAPESTLPLEVQILDQSLVTRFAVIVLDHVIVGKSDAAITSFLEKSGQRAVNNVVDISNELTLRLGQPVHIYDYDKVLGHKLILRQSKKGENVTTLDGQNHQLLGGDIVMTDGEGRLIDLCGIMGGDLSMVDEKTKRIILFVQTYDPKRVRRTSLYTQNRTVAAQIFEKGPDPEMVLPTVSLGIDLLERRAGARVASPLTDIYSKPGKTAVIKLPLDWLNKLAGIELDAREVRQILERLGFTVKGKRTFLVSPPSWRVQDIHLKEDLAEEILRVKGYFRLPQNLPTTQLALIEVDPLLRLESESARYLATAGFTEVVNYSLMPEALFAKAGLSSREAIGLKNPLSSDYTHLRTSLMPQLLETLALNQQREKGLYFEINNVYLNWDGENLPQEESHLALAASAMDYREFKGLVENWLRSIRVPKPDFRVTTLPTYKPAVHIVIGKQIVGHLGLIAPDIAAKFNLNQIPMAEFSLQELSKLAFRPLSFEPLSSFPEVIEDITVESKKNLGQLQEQLAQHPQVTRVEYLESLKLKHTFRIYFGAKDKNLTKEQVGELKNQILATL